MPSRVSTRLTAISAKLFHWPPARASALSNTSSTLARPAGLRWPEPLKITSCIDSPRSSLALLSPSTQRTASMMLDLPQPLGPTTPTRWPGNWKVVGSAKDLKPESLIWFRRIGRAARLLQVLDSCKEKAPEPGRRQGRMIASRPRLKAPSQLPLSAPKTPSPGPPSRVTERTHWAAVAAVLAAGLAIALNVGKVPVALPALRAELGLTLVQAGWVSSMLTTVAVFGAAFGRHVGRPRRRAAHGR